MRALAEPSSNRIKLWPLNESTGVRYSGPEVRWSELSGKPIPTYYVTHWGPTPSLRNPFGWKRLGEHYGRARRGTEDAEYRGLLFGRVINWGLYQGVWCRIFGTARTSVPPAWLDTEACWVPYGVRLDSVELFGDKIPWGERIIGGRSHEHDCSSIEQQNDLLVDGRGCGIIGSGC